MHVYLDQELGDEAQRDSVGRDSCVDGLIFVLPRTKVGHDSRRDVRPFRKI